MVAEVCVEWKFVAESHWHGVGDLTLVAAEDCTTPGRGFGIEVRAVPGQAAQDSCFV